MRGRTVFLLGLVGFLSFLSGGWLLQRSSQQSGSVYRKARLFDEILTRVSEHYVDSLDENRLYDLAADGMLAELGDPYSSILREREIRDLTLSTTGNYGGVGIQIDVRDGWITVVAPLPETPAEDAGIRSGDRIIAVDDRSSQGWPNERAVRELRGEPGTKVKLTVSRPGIPEPYTFELTRARVHLRAVQNASLLRPTVGYAALTTVSEASAAELAAAIDSLRAAGATSMVLDLRNNFGGLLDQGIAVSDLFLDRGQGVVETRGRVPGANRTYRGANPDRWPAMPVAVLINGGTASAAEIIAGALQDHDRALLVGTRSFGKGLVQTVFQLSTTEYLKLTTARWYTPSGRTIQAAQGPGPGSDTARAEVADTSVYRTDGGRLLRGGGGIHPDLEITADTLTSAERVFAQALGAHIPVYRDVLTTYALDLKINKTVTTPDFPVTPPMLAEIRRRMAARSVVLPDSVWSGAGTLISEQFGNEVARYVFDRSAEFRRQTRADVQLQRTLDLLGRATTVSDLFREASGAGRRN